MTWLQIRLFGSHFSSFSTNSYGYYSQMSQNLISNNKVYASAQILRQATSRDSPAITIAFFYRITFVLATITAPEVPQNTALLCSIAPIPITIKSTHIFSMPQEPCLYFFWGGEGPEKFMATARERFNSFFIFLSEIQGETACGFKSSTKMAKKT